MIKIFSTREVAIGVWLAILSLVLLFYIPARKRVADRLKSAFSEKSFSSFLCTIGLVILATFLFSLTPLWKIIYLKAVVIWVAFVLTPAFLIPLNPKAKKDNFALSKKNDFALAVLTLTVLAECFALPLTLPLILEIILVPIVSYFFMIDVVFITDNPYGISKKLICYMKIAITVCLIIVALFWATKPLVIHDTGVVLVSLFIPVILSAFYMFVLFIIATINKYRRAYSEICKEMSIENSKCAGRIKLIRGLKVIRTCGVSLKRLEQFKTNFIQQKFSDMTEADFENLMIDFREKYCFEKAPSQEEILGKRLFDEIKENNFHKTIKYINSHIGMFTLIATFALGLLSVFCKGLYYVFMFGKFDYWSIDRSYISVINENSIYEIVFFAAIAVIYATLNLISFSLLNSKSVWSKKLFNTILLVAITTFLIAIALTVGAVSSNDELSFDMIFSASIAAKLDYFMYIMPLSFWMTIFICCLGWGMFILLKVGKKRSDLPFYKYHIFRASTIMVFALGLAIYILMAYSFGWDSSVDKKKFKIIDGHSVVLYENSSHFVISKCSISENQIIIDSARQKQINKEGVETISASFEVVKRKTNSK